MNNQQNSKLNLHNTIASRIKQRLIDLDMQQKDIIDALGVPKSTVSEWVKKNEKRTPNTEYLIELSECLKCSVDYLVGKTGVATNDKDLQYICDYTGLSEQSIELIRKLCIPDFSTIILKKDEEDYNSEKEWLIKESQINKHSINAFISSKSFEYLSREANILTELNADVLAYLSLYFKDFEYFDDFISDEFDIVTNAKHFDNKYNNDSIHNAFQDKQDLIIFNIQRCIVSYFENFSNILFEIDNKGLTNTFDWLKYVVSDSINTAFNADKDIDTFVNRISEYGIPNGFNEDMSKLKEVFERTKANG